MRIAVIGGGPSGSFFSLRFLEGLRKKAGRAELYIIERKLFPKKGPSGCNLCAGLISSSMIRNLKKIGIEIPKGIIQSSIDSYVYHAEAGSKEFAQFRDEQVYTVYRGGGPLSSQTDYRKSFDQILLEKAVEHGAVHIHGNVNNVTMPKNDNTPYTVHYDDGKSLECDILVGAFGLNTTLVKRFKMMNFGYVPPKTMKVAQTEVFLPSGVPETFQNKVHVFNIDFRNNIKFIALTPKRNHITLTMVGNNPLKEDIDDFLSLPRIRSLLPCQWQRCERPCYCFPKIPLTTAKKPFRNRLVIIGDAHVSRFYKNGIGSAFYTASAAATSILSYGAGAKSFRSFYIGKCRKRYYRDNIYGKILFMLNDIIAQSPLLSIAPLVVAENYEKKYEKKKNILHFILWSLFTGEEPYRKILAACLNPKLLFDMLFQFVKIIATKLTGKKLNKC